MLIYLHLYQTYLPTSLSYLFSYLCVIPIYLPLCHTYSRTSLSYLFPYLFVIPIYQHLYHTYLPTSLSYLFTYLSVIPIYLALCHTYYSWVMFKTICIVVALNETNFKANLFYLNIFLCNTCSSTFYADLCPIIYQPRHYLMQIPMLLFLGAYIMFQNIGLTYKWLIL